MVATASTVKFNTERIEADMVLKGWLKSDLAAKARISPMTVTRFLRGEFQTAPVALKIAKALGYPLSRYLSDAERVA